MYEEPELWDARGSTHVLRNTLSTPLVVRSPTITASTIAPIADAIAVANEDPLRWPTYSEDNGSGWEDGTPSPNVQIRRFTTNLRVEARLAAIVVRGTDADNVATFVQVCRSTHALVAALVASRSEDDDAVCCARYGLLGALP
ncbi:hypothetical protein B0A52_06560 [Exophiala mesophila]|uniref:Uncharacterized protein n=1 Tax=Exophiala mesophila TaxID=212818 RepID=A0A438N1D4_EXOME|nr:hypothetical protein B0A52_06560 [Exophiala mesophila]